VLLEQESATVRADEFRVVVNLHREYLRDDLCQRREIHDRRNRANLDVVSGERQVMAWRASIRPCRCRPQKEVKAALVAGISQALSSGLWGDFETFSIMPLMRFRAEQCW
jgi:hypothetical protein